MFDVVIGVTALVIALPLLVAVLMLLSLPVLLAVKLLLYGLFTALAVMLMTPIWLWRWVLR